MAGPSAKRVSAASARAHTRGNKAKPTSFSLSPAIFAPMVLAFTVGLLGLAYQALKPPPPKICGSPGGPPITSPRVRLDDGRHLAYREMGIPKEEAKFKVIVIHPFASSKDLNLPVSQELVDKLRIYFLYFDRAGYGESDPHPSRLVKSEAYDIEELANKLQIGSKFYVIGISMGAYPVYSCLKYIPERLSGASLIVPVVNFWWPWLPANVSEAGLERLLPSDQWTVRVAHYTPWLLHWWMTQKWFPSFSFLSGNMEVFSPLDAKIIAKLSETPNAGEEKFRQQGDFESLHRDLLVGFGKWEFDIPDLSNPFPDNEGSVHLWQGYEDRIMPFQINRYISEKLPWIHYHEIPEAGHLLFFESKHFEAILKALLLG